ncbi:hypothetical protein LEN26_001013 [Aphanomyces euteiches]|nr:hypothetical protein AeMF1_019691 [Aphanomyces euteiches]KAH9118809.1 hypothetical protein AeMF1_008215 [Aphanomyces euteiches]KAH9162240.1 hypothetical protein LEN26_001013 [Aphanomyces euteiches]
MVRNQMIEQGIHHRKAKDIIQKISVIEASYRDARDWLENTGQGVEDEASITKEIKRRCQYFYELDEVMRDRPSSQALATSDDIENIEDGPSSDASNEELTESSDVKLDEWTVLQSRTFDLKEEEIRQRKDEIQSKQDFERMRLAIEERKEIRFEREALLNLRVLEIKKEQAELEFRVKKMETRKRLKCEGWSAEEIDLACPL